MISSQCRRTISYKFVIMVLEIYFGQLSIELFVSNLKASSAYRH